jgi:hypothetical protein
MDWTASLRLMETGRTNAIATAICLPSTSMTCRTLLQVGPQFAMLTSRFSSCIRSMSGDKEHAVILPQKLDEVCALVKATLAEEADAGFPRLSLCPSSYAIKFLDCFATLEQPDRDALLQSLARIGGGRFFIHQREVMEQVRALAMDDPATQRYRAAMQSPLYMMGMRHEGLRMTKAILNDPMSVAMRAQTRAKLDFTPRDDLPAALVPDPDFARIIPAKAPLLRPMINKAFKEMFATEKKKLPGGETVYSGLFENTLIDVGIDFGSRMHQLRYGVGIPDDSKTIFTSRLDYTYEGLWAGGTGWDYLTEENAERSIALLCDFVARLVRLRNAVRDLL